MFVLDQRQNATDLQILACLLPVQKVICSGEIIPEMVVVVDGMEELNVSNYKYNRMQYMLLYLYQLTHTFSIT